MAGAAPASMRLHAAAKANKDFLMASPHFFGTTPLCYRARGFEGLCQASNDAGGETISALRVVGNPLPWLRGATWAALLDGAGVRVHAHQMQSHAGRHRPGLDDHRSAEHRGLCRFHVDDAVAEETGIQVDFVDEGRPVR